MTIISMREINHLQQAIRRFLQKIEPTQEMCPHCEGIVELPPYLGIFECPDCGKLIISCSMCEEQSCSTCKFIKLTDQ